MTDPRSDTLIGDDVVRTLAQHGQSSQVLARVKDGHVIISGDVVSSRLKQQVGQRVASIDGVLSVDNKLNVDSGSDSFGSRGQAVRDNPDGEDAATTAEIDLGRDG